MLISIVFETKKYTTICVKLSHEHSNWVKATKPVMNKHNIREIISMQNFKYLVFQRLKNANVKAFAKNIHINIHHYTGSHEFSFLSKEKHTKISSCFSFYLKVCTLRMQTDSMTNLTPAGGFCIVFTMVMSFCFSVFRAARAASMAGIATASLASQSSCLTHKSRGTIHKQGQV